MTRRPPEQIGPLERIREFAATRQFAYAELTYPAKCVSRASLALEIGVGNHMAKGVIGSREETDEVVCLHAPLRSRSVLYTLAGHGKRAMEARNKAIWQWLRWHELGEAGQLEKEWLANSYQNDSLDVYGVPHELVFDSRLRDLVAPWVDYSPPDSERGRPKEFVPPLKVDHYCPVKSRIESAG